MNLSAVYHISTDNFCYPLNEKELVVKLQTDVDVDGAELVWGDPFEWGMFGSGGSWEGKHIQMTNAFTLKNHRIWQSIVAPAFKRCRYYFIVHSKNETYYVFEDGLKTESEMKNYKGRRQDFFFPWINCSDIVKPSKWVNETVWYQIFVDRFCSSLTDRGRIYHNWSSPDKKASNAYAYGGDLKGIALKLDYLKDLGITGIYLTPVNESTSNHKYNTKDYNKIDSSFGTDEDMKSLVKQAHSRGIRVMLDGVFNHCGAEFEPWQDVLKNGRDSRFFDWFFVNKYPFSKSSSKTRKGEYYSFAFVDDMPKLNTNNPETAQYFINVCRRWVSEYDIDAIRLDVSDEVSHSFNRQLRKALFEIKPDFFICGETWHNSAAWLRGDEFDSIMNYSLQEIIDSFWHNGDFTAKDFEHGVNFCSNQYQIQTNNVLLNLLDSHDTMRLITRCDLNEDIFFQELAALFTLNGSACIYYGTEIGLEGGYDPDCRRPMPWKEIEKGIYDGRLKTMKKLISLRKNNEELRQGNIRFIDSGNDRIIVYEKFSENKTFRIILNASGNSYPIDDRQFGNILFERNLGGGSVKPNGVVIAEVKNG